MKWSGRLGMNDSDTDLVAQHGASLSVGERGRGWPPERRFPTSGTLRGLDGEAVPGAKVP
jgi:hypothetical protein